MYFILFIPAIILNGVATWVCLHMRSTSTFMVYLKNLVAADLLMTLTIPLAASSKLPGHPQVLEAFFCRFSGPTFYCCMYMSIILLGLISLDRFFKVIKPWGRLLGQSLLFSKGISALVWVFLLSSNLLPTIFLTNQDPYNKSRTFCMNMKSEAGLQLHQSVLVVNSAIFWTASILIGLCYTCIARKVFQSYRNSSSTNDQGNKRVKARVFVVLVVFLLCFVPYHITRMSYINFQLKVKSGCIETGLRVLKDFTVWMATTNVCLDPLIYFFLCKAFREKLRELRPFGIWNLSQSSSNNEASDV